MIIRVVLLFLIVIVVLGMIGKWRLPRLPRRKPGTAVEAARKCSVCGAYAIGAKPAPCARETCPHR